MQEHNGRVLSILGATKCNLNCSYCFLHKNPAYLEEDAKVLAALQDGSYLKNIKKTLYELGIKYTEFDKFEVWGAETSLHYSESKDFFKEMLNTFPNIKEIGYSTNFMTDVQNQLDLIDDVEKYGPNEHYQFPLQISVDGPDWILEQTRHYKFEDLKKKIFEFIDAINRTKLHKVNVDLNLKATHPWSVLSKIISSKESIDEYYSFWNQVQYELSERVINGNLRIKTFNGFAPSLVYPDNFTKDDGILVANAARLVEDYDLARKYGLCFNPIFDIFGFDEIQNPYGHQGSCGKYVYSLVFKPDGSMAACSNGILDTNDKNLEWLKENDPQEYIESLRTRPYSYTYKEDGSVDYEAMKRHYAYMEGFWKYQPDFVLTNVCAQIYELSNAGIISPSYKDDFEKIYRHAVYISRKHGCYFTSLRATGTPYTPARGYLSLCCNGLLDYYEQLKRA